MKGKALFIVSIISMGFSVIPYFTNYNTWVTFPLAVNGGVSFGYMLALNLAFKSDNKTKGEQ